MALLSGANASENNMSKPMAGSQIAINTNGDSYPYLIYLPKDYDAKSGKKWPVLFFLHGSGERGTDINKVKIHGPPRLINEGQDFPFIVISPQLPEKLLWDVGRLDATMKHAFKGLKTDKSRIYLTGLSLGGMGTWAWAGTHTKLFAAIIPVCGMVNPVEASKFVNTPVWGFHGAKDDVVPFQGTSFILSDIKIAGNQNAKITLYPEANHDSWTQTYANPEIYEWLLKFKR